MGLERYLKQTHETLKTFQWRKRKERGINWYFMQKISEMSRTELKDYMNALGAFHRPDKHQREWDRAFELYEKSTGARVDKGCGSCFSKVSEWMRKD